MRRPQVYRLLEIQDEQHPMTEACQFMEEVHSAPGSDYLHDLTVIPVHHGFDSWSLVIMDHQRRTLYSVHSRGRAIFNSSIF